MTQSEAHKLWGGRFTSGPAPELDRVNRSIGVDFRLWPFDVELSRAWAAALGRAGVITEADASALRRGLDDVAAQLSAGAAPAPSDEDIHTMIDRLLHDAAGDVASRLHTGRSRNDQVATATRLWTIDALRQIDRAVGDVQRALATQAAALVDAIMPAYTHMQRAQPVSAAHWMLSHFWPLERDRARLATARAAANVMPLGSGAVAGSAFGVDRAMLARDLGFDAVSPNSIDAVSDRDFVLESLFALTMLGTHLSRLAEDLILYGASEFGFVRFSDAFSTGSSMMPQKRNPDALELARGSAARMLGDLVSGVAMLKGLPSSYNKDMQDDKRALFDAVDGMLGVLPAVAGTVGTLTFDFARMRQAVTGSMMATDLADYLVRRGVSFRDAHRAVGLLVREAEDRGCELPDLARDSFTRAHALFGDDALAACSAEHSLAQREITGGTGRSSVQEQLRAAQRLLSEGEAQR